MGGEGVGGGADNLVLEQLYHRAFVEEEITLMEVTTTLGLELVKRINRIDWREKG